jgi:putative transposase
MSLLIELDMLIEWQASIDGVPAPESHRVERILWLDAERQTVITIDIFAHGAMPILCLYDDLTRALTSGEARILSTDPYAELRRRDQDITTSQRQRRDETWRVLGPLIAEHNTELLLRPDRRGLLIRECAAQAGLSKAVIYKYLRRYWQAGRTRNALLPAFDKCGGRGKRRHPRTGTQEAAKLGRPGARAVSSVQQLGVRITPEIERKFERGIKQFYETRAERSLRDAYQLTLEAFFHDGYTLIAGVPVPVLPVAEVLPSFGQFRYWYDNHRDAQRADKARRGERAYNLTGRALLGDSTQMASGPGSLYQIDATIGDIYLVSSFDRTRIIGRPVIYVCIDVFSRLLTGIAVTLEGPSWLGAMLALDNVAEDKVAFCAGYGIEITEEMWPCHHLPEALLTDRGEFESYDADNLVGALGISVHNTPPYRADWKGIVERHFRIANDKFIHFMPGAVSRQRDRGEADHRLDAVLTLDEFRKLFICHVLNYNAHHYLSDYQKDSFMIADAVERYPLDLWNWGIGNCSGHLRTLPREIVRLNLLPRKQAAITPQGIRFERELYYTCELALREGWFTRAGRRGASKIEVAYDPRSVDLIYLCLESGRRLEICHLTTASAKAFWGRDWHEVIDYSALEAQAKDAARTRFIRSEAEAHALQKQIVTEAMEKTLAARASAGRQSKRARTRGIIANRELERQNERNQEGWRLSTKEPALSPPTPPNPGDEEEGYVPPISKVSRIRELRDKEWNNKR